jgi:hypothetical protein
MTITRPESDPSYLETVIGVEHDRLATMLSELTRVTPTPGAWETLVVGLRAELQTHVVSEQRVVLPAAAPVVGEDEVGAWSQGAAELGGLVEALAAHPFDDTLLSSARTALDGHRHRCEGLLPPLRDALGGKAMAQLGYDYTDR